MKKTLLQKAMDITELSITMENIAQDDKRVLESYTDAEILHEAEYCLSCFYEGGHQSNDELNSDDPEERRAAKKQVAALKKMLGLQ
jgi:hypothetical protein